MNRTAETIEVINRLFGRNNRLFLDPVPQARHRNNGNHAFDQHAVQKVAVQFAIMLYLNKTSGITDEMFPLTTFPLTMSYFSVELTFFINRLHCHFVNGDRSCDVRARYQISCQQHRATTASFS